MAAAKADDEDDDDDDEPHNSASVVPLPKMKKARKKPGKASDDDDDDEPHDSVSVAFVPKGKKARKKPGKASDDDDDDDDDSHDSASVVAVNARKKSGKKSGDQAEQADGGITKKRKIEAPCPCQGCTATIFTYTTGRIPTDEAGAVGWDSPWTYGHDAQSRRVVKDRQGTARDHCGLEHPGSRLPAALQWIQMPGVNAIFKELADKKVNARLKPHEHKRKVNAISQKFGRAVKEHAPYQELKKTAYTTDRYVVEVRKMIAETDFLKWAIVRTEG
jgi:hypothetical protein